MSGGLALSKVDVAGDELDGTVKAVAITVRGGKAGLYRDGALVQQRATVTRIERHNRRTWLVMFDDGGQWTVVRDQRDCGCGR